jgi:hypothetical protein
MPTLALACGSRLNNPANGDGVVQLIGIDPLGHARLRQPVKPGANGDGV